MAENSSRWEFAEGCAALSDNDDLGRLRSMSAAASMGLSRQANPRKGMGPVQIAARGSLFGFIICSRCLGKGEGSEKGLPAALMNMIGESFVKNLEFSPGCMLGVNRGLCRKRFWKG